MRGANEVITFHNVKAELPLLICLSCGGNRRGRYIRSQYIHVLANSGVAAFIYVI